MAALALGAPGCVTGHLLDFARRREQPTEVVGASLDGDRLVLAYEAVIANDRGKPLGRAERRASVSVADLRRGDVPVESFPVERLPDGVTLPGVRVPLAPCAARAAAAGGGAGATPPAPPFLEVEGGGAPGEARLVLHEAGAAPASPFYASALTRTWTAPWVYPLLPLSAVFDAATVPPLMLFAPAVMAVGD